MSTQPNVLYQWFLLKCLTSGRKYHDCTLWKNICTLFWVHDITAEQWRRDCMNHVQLSVILRTEFGNPLSVFWFHPKTHYSVKGLHSGQGPQKIKQEIKETLQRRKIIWFTLPLVIAELVWRTYIYSPMHRRSSVAVQLKVHCFLTRGQINKLFTRLV